MKMGKIIVTIECQVPKDLSAQHSSRWLLFLYLISTVFFCVWAAVEFWLALLKQVNSCFSFL